MCQLVRGFFSGVSDEKHYVPFCHFRRHVGDEAMRWFVRLRQIPVFEKSKCSGHDGVDVMGDRLYSWYFLQNNVSWPCASLGITVCIMQSLADSDDAIIQQIRERLAHKSLVKFLHRKTKLFRRDAI